MSNATIKWTSGNSLGGWMLGSILVIFSGCSFSSKTTQRYFKKEKHNRYDVIIVPGVPLQNGKWDRTMKTRVYWSKFLYDAGIARNIIYSGSAVYSPYYEGKVMAQYAIALGIPAAHVFAETRAEHSTENVYYSWRLAKKLGFKTFALATDPFQSKQLRRYIAKKVDPAIGIIPFVPDTLRVMESHMIDPVIEYERSAKQKFISIKKRESLRKRWRGTRGLNIDKNAYR